MTPKEAALLIGCHERYVRALIKKGELKARQIDAPHTNNLGYRWDISEKAVERFNRDHVQTKGFPMGKKRDKKKEKKNGKNSDRRK